MIILDTNVVSELIRKTPDVVAVRWLNQQPPESIWTTSLSIFELRFGFSLMQPGRHRQALEAAFVRLVEKELENRVLDFDSTAAAEAATLGAARQRAGRGVEIRDTLIAGIAVTRRATIATRNTRHFADLPVPVVDPWSAQV